MTQVNVLSLSPIYINLLLCTENIGPGVTDYRPISLCNVAYKIASKVVASRMKSILQEIISENQSAFVAERLIIDNVLVAHQLMNHINKKKKGKCGEMAVKLDMSKAYNRLNGTAYNKSCRSLVSINNGLAL